MKKKTQRLMLSRETLRHLSPSQLDRLGVQGGDREPPFTRTIQPTSNAAPGGCTNQVCGESVTCDSVVIC